MGKRFFYPFVGADYTTGIYKGIKLLILGESHYCPYNSKSKVYNCANWNECTSIESKDSSMYNYSCPYYNDKTVRVFLEDSSIDEIQSYIEGSDNTSYNNFFNFLGEYFGICEKNSLCNRIAFSNYVQYFQHTYLTLQQKKCDIRNFESFIETIEELQPDIIIVWGMPITNHFKKRYIQQKVQQLIEEDDNYFWTLVHNDARYTIINCYHPCDINSWWSNNLGSFKSALDKFFRD